MSRVQLREDISLTRHVKTEAGVKHYGKPIGTELGHGGAKHAALAQQHAALQRMRKAETPDEREAAFRFALGLTDTIDSPNPFKKAVAKKAVQASKG